MKCATTTLATSIRVARRAVGDVQGVVHGGELILGVISIISGKYIK